MNSNMMNAYDQKKYHHWDLERSSSIPMVARMPDMRALAVDSEVVNRFKRI